MTNRVSVRLRRSSWLCGRNLLPNADWKLHDAKARFSELVRRARTEGPQRVTVRGHDSVVVIAAEELERLLPPDTEVLPFVTFMESLTVERLDLTRAPDVGRDVAL